MSIGNRVTDNYLHRNAPEQASSLLTTTEHQTFRASSSTAPIAPPGLRSHLALQLELSPPAGSAATAVADADGEVPAEAVSRAGAVASGEWPAWIALPGCFGTSAGCHRTNVAWRQSSSSSLHHHWPPVL
jgi:hypothetical protein